MPDRPLSEWITLARMSFENDLHRLFDQAGISRADLAERVGSSQAYVSKVFNGTAGNFQLSTMAKFARAIGAIVQIRLIKEGKEVVRVVDYQTAGALDDAEADQLAAARAPRGEIAKVLTFPAMEAPDTYRPLRSQGGRYRLASASALSGS